MFDRRRELPENLRELFPYKSHYLTLPDGEFMHYVDEGEGPVLLMVHGNPTWPFFFRELIGYLRHFYRVIVPSHIGMGLSSRPQSYNYVLKQHVRNLSLLLKHLDVQEYSMIVHDWGGPIGLGAALETPRGADSVRKLVLMNTAAFRSMDIPKRISLCRDPLIGEWLVRAVNGFAAPATYMAVTKGMSHDVRQGYLYPYRTYRDRVAVARFVQDIPLEADHDSLPTLKKIEDALPRFNCPKLLLWGAKDFCFHTGFYQRWAEIYPNAQKVLLKKAGHYLLEDAPRECREAIDDFLKRDDFYREPTDAPYKVLWDSANPEHNKHS